MILTPDTVIISRGGPDIAELKADPKNAYRLDNDQSAWVDQLHGFPVVDVRVDRAKWVRDWDEGVKKISLKSASDAFSGTVMMLNGSLFRRRIEASDREMLRAIEMATKDNHRTYPNNVRELFGNPMLARYSLRDWFMLVDMEERTRILSSSIEETCWNSMLGQDARMICPEIISTVMLKRRGMELFAFFDRYLQMALSEDETEQESLIQTEWWSSALQLEGIPQPLHENVTHTYKLYTCFRRDFLDMFVLRTAKAICKAWGDDMFKGLTTAPRLMWNASHRGLRSIVAARKDAKSRETLSCENCERSPVEIGANVRFLVCATCKRNLNFACWYCSRQCQRSDWRKHKVFCGKEKVSKSRQQGRPEYTRSLQLLLQLELQSEDDDVDYFIFNRAAESLSGSLPFKAAFLTDEDKQTLFREKRVLAAMDADRTGLDVVAKCIIDALEDDKASSGITREHVIQQLSEEYGVDVGSRLEALQAQLTADGDENLYSGMCVYSVAYHEDLVQWAMKWEKMIKQEYNGLEGGRSDEEGESTDEEESMEE
ncbi:hypothetical protein CONPUDRAFT_161859 [Coniophora puteana RWD-64-598 SS2]|uniref:MYND-type domain-containing protein n=1 Tax=Coniophora puteana (strain RWD-64-598) TaxID=741705 RepID=A0A5M3N8W7_CONPW|nr:uncharacterized protein CONPUDRAFT_161859 [Coniophora puteana RWD-64-598 SS2]EIW87285.1 hypothetical protein CONPUDRAFT_161859 [Coniophora puteana RWD-64-598 SS2]